MHPRSHSSYAFASLLLAIGIASSTACGLDESSDSGEEALGNDQAAAFYTKLPSGLTKDTGDLKTIMEVPRLEGACERHFARLDAGGKIQREKIATAASFAKAQEDFILCGKAMFFNPNLPSKFAIPSGPLDALSTLFPDETGPVFSKIGLRANPYEPEYPVDLPRIPRYPGKPEIVGGSRGLSCTACHIGTLPDGRLSIGMPNESFDSGRFNALMEYLIWLAAKPNDQKNETRWDKSLIKYYAGLDQKIQSTPIDFTNWKYLRSRALLDSARLAGWAGIGGAVYGFIEQEPPPLADQRTYLGGKPGIFHPGSPMLGEQNVEVYMTPPPIWRMDHREGTNPDPYLGFFAKATSLEKFVGLAIIVSTGTPTYAVPKYIDPMSAYLRTVQAPSAPGTKNPTTFARGESLFNAQCASCHNGYEGATRSAYPMSQIGTSSTYDRMFQSYNPPNRQSREMAKLIGDFASPVAGRKDIKARRLTAIWARKLLGYTGTVSGLNGLLCLDGKKRALPNRTEPLSDGMHQELCNGSEADRKALREYLTFAF